MVNKSIKNWVVSFVNGKGEVLIMTYVTTKASNIQEYFSIYGMILLMAIHPIYFFFSINVRFFEYKLSCGERYCPE